MVEETPEALAEKIRQQVDAALTRRLENPACLAPASLIRILYPVVEKHLTAGLLLDEIASALQEEGYKVTKGHLIRHLGTIREERGLPPLRRGKRTKGGVEEQGSGQPRAAARSAPVADATNIPASAPAPVAPVEPIKTARKVVPTQPARATTSPPPPPALPDEDIIPDALDIDLTSLRPGNKIKVKGVVRTVITMMGGEFPIVIDPDDPEEKRQIVLSSADEHGQRVLRTGPVLGQL